MKSDKVQIDFALFFRLVMYFGEHPHPEDPSYSEIRSGILAKIDAMQKHELYSRSKTAPTESEREKARLEYLEKAGISAGFRWSPEYKNSFKQLLEKT
ncbi:MAG: complexin-2 [Psychrobacillus sp.]